VFPLVGVVVDLLYSLVQNAHVCLLKVLKAQGWVSLEVLQAVRVGRDKQVGMKVLVLQYTRSTQLEHVLVFRVISRQHLERAHSQRSVSHHERPRTGPDEILHPIDRCDIANIHLRNGDMQRKLIEALKGRQRLGNGTLGSQVGKNLEMRHGQLSKMQGCAAVGCLLLLNGPENTLHL
jgi:hypothetical protein